MPEFDGRLWVILLVIFLWGRGMSVAAKRSRQRRERALEASGGKPEGTAASREVREVEAPPPRAGRPGLREQLQGMGRQLEQQMRQAAEEGRPGSLVAHVDAEDAPETPVFLHRPRPAAREVGPSDRGGRPPRAPAPAPRPVHRPPPRPQRSVARGTDPLVRLERYPALARAVILSEILGPPPGLSEEPRD